jgi:hypothetical protein
MRLIVWLLDVALQRWANAFEVMGHDVAWFCLQVCVWLLTRLSICQEERQAASCGFVHEGGLECNAVATRMPCGCIAMS